MPTAPLPSFPVIPESGCRRWVSRFCAGPLLGFIGAAFLFLGGTGCAGYQLGSAKPAYLQNIHRIAVPAFRNNTLVPRLEGTITGTVVKQLQQDGTFEIAPNDSSADAVLNVSIENVTRNPARSVRGNVLLTSEFTLTLGLRFQLVDRATGRVLETGFVEGRTNFFVGGDAQQEERQAIPIAAERAAVSLTSRLSEGF